MAGAGPGVRPLSPPAPGFAAWTVGLGALQYPCHLSWEDKHLSPVLPMLAGNSPLPLVPASLAVFKTEEVGSRRSQVREEKERRLSLSRESNVRGRNGVTAPRVSTTIRSGRNNLVLPHHFARNPTLGEVMGR